MSRVPYLTKLRPQITDLDSLPIPDRSLVDYEKHNKYIGHVMVKNAFSLQASRGCPYKCAYCHKIWPKRCVMRSAENLFAEVRLGCDLGVRRFSFVDDIFNFDAANSRRFFELILKNGLEVQFFFPNALRGDLLNEEFIDLMVKAGTTSVGLSLETASPRLQKLIGKYLNIEKLRKNAEYFIKKYPHVILELQTMHGFPSETEDEAMLTLDFIKSLRWVHFPYVNILKIYLNTDMEKIALENGISYEAIVKSEHLGGHELPETLPFDKKFTTMYQADYFNEYFLSKERLLNVLPYQMKCLTEDEIAQKYNSYLPVDIGCFDDLLQFLGITREELAPAKGLSEESIAIPDINKKLKQCFPREKPDDNALGVLLLDLTQFFSAESHILYDVVEVPLGLMYLMTYLTQRFGSKIKGKIAKSRIDFDNYPALKGLLEEFRPDVIGIRSLTYYKFFFHQTVAMIRQWGIDVPIIVGGPYATSGYGTILQDKLVNLVVIGEGEITFSEIIGEILKNNGKLPGEEILAEIPGLAFVRAEPDQEKNPPGVQGQQEDFLNFTF
jgi:radical SAM superfamily enzyme YgiQ (UPF0313 family)